MCQQLFKPKRGMLSAKSFSYAPEKTSGYEAFPYMDVEAITMLPGGAFL